MHHKAIKAEIRKQLKTRYPQSPPMPCLNSRLILKDIFPVFPCFGAAASATIPKTIKNVACRAVASIHCTNNL